MRRSRFLAATAVAAAMLTSAACSGTSKSTPASSASSTVPARTTAVPSGPLRLTPGEGIDTAGAFSSLMTCDDPNDYSPGLNIADVPSGTAELALSMVDLDAQKIHWLQLGIPPTTRQLKAHELTPGAREALNDLGEATYTGPCPPSGTTHRYQLTLYALHDAVPASFGKDTPPGQTLKELQSRANSTAQLTATYKRR